MLPKGPSELMWRLGEVEFYAGDKRVQIGGPYNFTSAWMAAGMDEEWVYVDLGARCDFDRIALYWIARAAEGTIQLSDDAQNWRDLQPLPNGPDSSMTSGSRGLHRPVTCACS